MAQYIFGARNKIHIVNLEKTLPMFQEAQEAVRRLVANKGTVLFVGTKRQTREIIRKEATRADMPGYEYDPDTADGFSGADYLPDGVERQPLYEPTANGHERRIRERLEYWQDLRARKR